MSKEEYFAVFESLLYGLALAHILVSISRMVAHRKSIKLYWVHLALLIAGILVLPQRYFAGFHAEEYQHVNSAAAFFFLLMMPMGLYFIIAYQIFPEKIEGTDFKEFFWDKHKEIIVVFVLFAVFVMVRNIMKDQYSISDGEMTQDGYFQSARFLTFVLAISVLSGLGVLGIVLKKKSLIKVLAVITLAYNVYIFLIT